MAAPRVNPLPGLQNCLSAHQCNDTLSVLSDRHILLLTASDRTASLNDAVMLKSAHSARVHASTRDHLFVTVQHRRITVITPTNSYSSATPLHFEEHAIAVDPLVTHHSTPANTAAIAVGGYDGVYFTAFHLDKNQFDDITELPGTGGHKMVCVAIRDHTIAAANMDGRVGIWRHYHSTYAATAIVQPPPRLVAGDRVTDISLCQHGFIVAWWSGSLFLYDQNAHLVWASYRSHSISSFGVRSGTFLTCVNRFVVACHGSGALTWIDLDAQRYACQNVCGDVKGLCSAGGHLFLWDFEVGIQRIPVISNAEFEQRSESMSTEVKNKPRHQ
ncbi:hypothetical protein BWQ96_05364 [Gracilariopsis chorda]|uniref:Uncharacterized protein n=1 Tax=Gracilariopsis chorda TaxID=448386 RepID=A0A2V3IRY7_9FLOR|nr:hypothetical protein BWQ96_05364 [Gracilariopsis chorda]|eukprot:PXF44874.1 hypothetical protein BWQ96_05364 [Gracilariopsis chorda]